MDLVTASNEPQIASPERSAEQLAQAASTREPAPSQTASSPPSQPDAGAGGDASAGGALALAPSDDSGYAADSEDEHESNACEHASAPADESNSPDGSECEPESEDACASEDQSQSEPDGPGDDCESRSDAEDGGGCASGDDGWDGHADSDDDCASVDAGHANADKREAEDDDDCESEGGDDCESEDDDGESESDDGSEDEGDDGSDAGEHGSEDDRAALDALAPTARNRRKRTLDEDEQPRGKRARVGRSLSEAIYGQAGRISAPRQWRS